MIYIKDVDTKYKTLKELAEAYNLPIKLLRGRWMRGIRTLEEMVQPKQTDEK